MARIPREDNVDKPTSELAINLQNMLDTISENFKTLVDGDTLKVSYFWVNVAEKYFISNYFYFYVISESDWRLYQSNWGNWKSCKPIDAWTSDETNRNYIYTYICI